MTENELRIVIKDQAMNLVIELRAKLDEIMAKLDEYQPRLLDKYQDLEVLIEAVKNQAIESDSVFVVLWEDTND